ncbi:oxygen-independent coproporphyrinogen III oxidase [uncultured Sulfitobacter sp.]|uniref:oxygen-independent coproporphyrinogen III oxidase n=1 Tax=uncultured Sulfitobacter sp. TaxID=191468 RepID=UPI00261EF051|nr:oxygen-independent coproporphyrinogen III oxidase [uncultured Sulfitobacter sp.]
MEKIDRLRHYGLFDAQVPRYTSYPPANHFAPDAGQVQQLNWLRAVPGAAVVSIYIHIPFCRRLCWFCACRTQGTKTRRPVDDYVDVLRKEIASVRATLPAGIRMGRLHLGGGTPTILSARTMQRLLETLFANFKPAETLEFSVEIDPTDASDSVLKTLLAFGMNRASIGVQDFTQKVQAAIGRAQSLEQTRRVVDIVRGAGIGGVNFDLLYGLPHQTTESFAQTLRHVGDLRPDRLAIYGYAHVPWISKRQMLIRTEDLPDNEARLGLAEMTRDVLCDRGYEAIGIDHFAMPDDPLAIAAREGRLRRNFQGYTDDRCAALIGLGASSISRFPHGYVQNQPATSTYLRRIETTGLAGRRGYVMTDHDQLVAMMIEDLMCRFAFREDALREKFPKSEALIRRTAVSLMSRFPDVFFISRGGLKMQPEFRQLVRIVASFIDGFAQAGSSHSSAI